MTAAVPTPMDPAVLAKQADALRAGLALLAIVNGAVPLRISAPATGVLYVSPGRAVLEYRSEREDDEYNLSVLRTLSEILGRPLAVSTGSDNYLSVKIELVLFDVEVRIYEAIRTPEVRATARQLITPASSEVAA